jgi:P2-related tail formation protein
MMGFNEELNTLYLSSTLAMRRKILQKIAGYYQIKGTLWAYQLQLSVLGCTVVITEHYNDYGFDSPVTFDDTVRRFDMKCSMCSTYELAITGSGSLTAALEAAIRSIIKFNEPINAKLIALTYNGGGMTPGRGDFNNDENEDFFNN